MSEQKKEKHSYEEGLADATGLAVCEVKDARSLKEALFKLRDLENLFKFSLKVGEKLE